MIIEYIYVHSSRLNFARQFFWPWPVAKAFWSCYAKGVLCYKPNESYWLVPGTVGHD